MSDKIRVLVLEDQPDDAELMIYELRLAGYAPEWERVEDENAYVERLSPDLDIILSDYTLPEFNGLEALHRLQEHGLDIPFIIVTGAISEEVAVECMKQGAADYLLKDRLARLGPAVTQALEQKNVRRERQQALAALRESEERFRRLAENALDIIYRYTLDPGPRLEYISPAVTAITGYTPEEHYANPRLTLDLVIPEDRPSFEASLQGALPAGTPIVLRWRRRDGGLVWMEHRNVPIYEGGRLAAVEGITRDVTERQLAEDRLLASENRFRTLAETTSAAIFIFEPAGSGPDSMRIRYANTAATLITGYSCEELLNMRFWELAHPSYQSSLKQGGAAIQFVQDIPARYEIKIITRNEQERWVDVTAGKIEFEGRPATVGTAFDITDRTQAEEELRVSLRQLRATREELVRHNEELTRARQRYQELFEFAPDGYLVTDVDGAIQEANHTAAQMLLLPQADLIGKPLIEFIGQVDQYDFRELLERLQKGEEIRNWEVLMQRWQNLPFPASVTVASVRDPAMPERLVGLRWLVRNVTERRQMERALRRSRDELEALVQVRTAQLTQANEAMRQSEARYRALFENMSESVSINEMIYDGEGRPVDWIIRDVNPAFTRSTGIAREKADGQPASVLFGPVDPGFLRMAQHVIETGQAERIQSRYPLQQPFWWSLFPLGEKLYAALGIDIPAHEQNDRKPD